MSKLHESLLAGIAKIPISCLPVWMDPSLKAARRQPGSRAIAADILNHSFQVRQVANYAIVAFLLPDAPGLISAAIHMASDVALNPLQYLFKFESGHGLHNCVSMVRHCNETRNKALCFIMPERIDKQGCICRCCEMTGSVTAIKPDFGLLRDCECIGFPIFFASRIGMSQFPATANRSEHFKLCRWQCIVKTKCDKVRRTLLTPMW